MALGATGPIGIAGGGRIGQALGHLLFERGEPVAAVACRRLDQARTAAAFIGDGVVAVPCAEMTSRASRILITVPDDAITEVAAVLADAGMREGMALHTCGALGLDVLAPLSRQGVSCASLHPLQTVPTPAQGVASLPAAWFAVSGGGPAAAWARRIVDLIGGRAFEVPEEVRSLYHAGAVMACNFLVAMVDAAVALFGRAGLEREKALEAIAPLVSATAANVFRLGPEKALTGAIARGDAATIRAHLAGLAGAPEPVRELYRTAARYTIDLARRGGLEEAKARQLERLFTEPGG